MQLRRLEAAHASSLNASSENVALLLFRQIALEEPRALRDNYFRGDSAAAAQQHELSSTNFLQRTLNILYLVVELESFVATSVMVSKLPRM